MRRKDKTCTFDRIRHLAFYEQVVDDLRKTLTIDDIKHPNTNPAFTS